MQEQTTEHLVTMGLRTGWGNREELEESFSEKVRWDLRGHSGNGEGAWEAGFPVWTMAVQGQRSAIPAWASSTCTPENPFSLAAWLDLPAPNQVKAFSSLSAHEVAFLSELSPSHSGLAAA